MGRGYSDPEKQVRPFTRPRRTGPKRTFPVTVTRFYTIHDVIGSVRRAALKECKRRNISPEKIKVLSPSQVLIP